MEKQERNYTFDTLRVLAAFLVILLHVSAGYVLKNLGDINNAFWAGNIYNSFARVSVPLFILISGYFLIGRDESAVVFYKKRWNKLFIPFIFWSLLYTFYNLVLMYQHHEVDPVLLFKYLGLGIPYYHLWYLFLIIGLYAVTPFINQYVAARGVGAACRWGVVVLAAGIFLDVWDTYFHNQQFFGVWFVKYLGYFILGYTLPRQHWVQKITKMKRGLFLGGYLVGSFGIAFATVLAIPYLHKNLYFYSFLNPFAVMASISLYLFFTQIHLKKNSLACVSPLTFGIYLLHAAILDRLLTFSSYWSSISPWVIIPSLATGIFILAAAITVILQHIPYLKKTV